MEQSEQDTSQVSSTSTSTFVKKKIFSNFVEFPLFIFFSSYYLADTVYKNLILYQTCTVTYGFNKTICSLLTASNHSSNSTKELEDMIQPEVAKILMAITLVQGIFPAILSLFLGPWSDTHGRKPLLVSSLIGYLLYFVANIVLMQFETLNPWWYVLPSVPFSVLGGVASLITGVFCYVCDITDNENRSYRLGFLEGCLFVGVLFGSLGSSFILQVFGYLSTFILCLVLSAIACLFAMFILEESIPPVVERDNRKILDYTYITNMIKVCCKKRTNYERLIIWLVMTTSSLGIFAMQGESSVYYLFTREKFGWDLQEYALFSSFSICSAIVGILVSALIFKKCKARDATMSMIAFIFSSIKSIVTLFAANIWYMYVGDGLTFLRVVSGPINRSLLSKMVPVEDIGKVLSLTTSLEAIIPMAATPLYAIFYENTLTTCPSAFNIFSASIYVFCSILLGVVDYLLIKYPSTDYSHLSVEE